MGVEKCNAVVLRFADFKEADRMLTLFSREEGKISAAIKGVRKQNSKLRSGAELFAFGEYIFNDKAGRLTVTGYSSLDTYYPIREDLERLWCATLAVNMIETVATSQPEPELFDLLVYTLSQFAYNAEAPSLAVLNGFILNFLSIAGVYPQINACSCQGEKIYYSTRRNGMVCRNCAGTEYIALDADTVSAISGEPSAEDNIAVLSGLSDRQLKKLFNMLVTHASFCFDKHFKAATFLNSII